MNGGHIVHKFNLDGSLLGIENKANKEDDGRTVLFFKDYYSIASNIAKDVRKTTVFNKDGSKEVSIVNFNDKSEKMAMYSKDGVMLSYIDVDKDGKKLVMNFDKQGNLYNIG